ncbi:MAG: AAA family ATPase [Gemmatimonadota bacterium]
MVLRGSKRRVRRVVVIGSESTGKTALASRLATLLSTPWLPEYAREFAERVGRPLTAADVEPIARGQRDREDSFLAAAEQNCGQACLVVMDTDLVSTSVYAEHYYGDCPAWVADASRRRLADLYLLADIDIPWKADSVRDRPTLRREMHQTFVSRLTELGANVELIRGRGEERPRNALASVRGWRASALRPDDR